MFRYDPSIRRLPASAASVAWLAESSNQPNVAVPGRQAQAAHAYAVALRRPGGALTCYVSLWLTLDREPAIYVHQQERATGAALDRLAEDAREFCESMGFILDVVPLRDEAAAADRARILARLRREEDADDRQLGAEPPTALATPGPAAVPANAFEPTPEQIARLGKLLASF